jgi:hypothetical protein
MVLLVRLTHLIALHFLPGADLLLIQYTSSADCIRYVRTMYNRSINSPEDLITELSVLRYGYKGREHHIAAQLFVLHLGHYLRGRGVPRAGDEGHGDPCLRARLFLRALTGTSLLPIGSMDKPMVSLPDVLGSCES